MLRNTNSSFFLTPGNEYKIAQKYSTEFVLSLFKFLFLFSKYFIWSDKKIVEKYLIWVLKVCPWTVKFLASYFSLNIFLLCLGSLRWNKSKNFRHASSCRFFLRTLESLSQTTPISSVHLKPCDGSVQSVIKGKKKKTSTCTTH